MEFLSILKTENKNAKNYILAFFCWVGVSLLLGSFSGVIGAWLYSAVHKVANIRNNYEFLIYFLPLFGVLTVLIYRLLGLNNQNTNTVFSEVQGKAKTSSKLLPAVFGSTLLTHLGGGSAGKEGAALQIGGSLAKIISKIFKLNEKATKILLISGMAAVFSAAFGTPLTAAVFALTVIRVGKIYFSAILPTFLSSLSAYFVARLLGVYPLSCEGGFSGLDLLENLKLLFIIAASAVVGLIYVKALSFSKKFFKKLIKNEYNRILLGGVLIVVLSFVFGSEYLGDSMKLFYYANYYDMINKEAFILKILFTAITIGVGFKGGEIVPALVIGATFGGALSAELGFSIAVGAVYGAITLFCAATKAPLASFVLAIEVFGFYNIPYYLIAVILAMLLSGKESLYSAQEYLIFRKKDNKEKKTV